MNKHKLSLIVLCLVLAGLALLPSQVARAQTDYPERADKRLNDYANLLEPSEAQSIHDMLYQFEALHKVQVCVLTVGSIHDYATGDDTIESFATNLFNDWGIGDRERNDGVLILLAVDDRQVRVELGLGYGHRLDGPMQQVIDETMLPRFRQGDYAGGLVAGTEAVIKTITDDLVGETSSEPSGGDGFQLGNVLFSLLLASLVGGLVWIGYRAFRVPSAGRGIEAGEDDDGIHTHDDLHSGVGHVGHSSGGGSSGGGTSGGGGASGDW